MTAKTAAIYLMMIGIYTIGGFIAGECVKHAESTFMAHQIQMYNGIFPGIHNQFDQIRWQEAHQMQAQIITIITSMIGFIMGATIVNRNAHSRTVGEAISLN